MAGTDHASHALVFRRPQCQGDDGFHAALFAETRSELLGALPAELRAIVMQQQLAAQAAGHAARHPQACYEIVEMDGVAIGRLVTAREGAILHVVDIALLSIWRGRGIGSTLLRAVQDEADKAGVSVRLVVATTNVGALRFYHRLGFEGIDRSDFDVEMEWSPNAPPPYSRAGT